MKISFLLILASCWSVISLAQFRISGHVKDREDIPVPGVRVQLTSGSGSGIYFDHTDTAGYFIAENVERGEYIVTLSAFGYQPHKPDTLYIDRDILLPVFILHEAEVRLNEITVRSSRPVIEIAAGKTVVHVGESLLSAGKSLMEVLQTAPGVRVDEQDRIYLKGKPDVMIWINGRPAAMSGEQLAAMLKSMPSEAIEKIEMISNPGSKYDAAGGAGIINIIMKKDRRIGWNGQGHAFYGQGVYPKYGAGGSASYRNGKIHAFGSYNYTMRYWFNHLMIDRKFTDTAADPAQLFRYDQDHFVFYDFRSHMANAGMDYQVTSATTAGFSINIATNSFDPKATSNSNAYDQEEGLIYRFHTRGDHHNLYYNYSANAYIRHAFDSAGKAFTADIDYARFGNRSNQYLMTTYEYPDGMPYAPDSRMKSRLEGGTDIRAFKADYIHPISADGRLETGGKVSLVKADNHPFFMEMIQGVYEKDTGRSHHFVYGERIYAGYASLNKDWGKYHLQIGIRAEYTDISLKQHAYDRSYDTAYVQLFPSIALQYDINAHHTIGITGSRRVERPDYQQLNPFKYFVDKTTYREGYPYLNPASFYAAELTHTYKKQWVTSFTFGIHRGIITEVIQPSERDTGRVTVQTYKNLDQMLFAGISGTYLLQFHRNWQSSTSFNAYYARYDGHIAHTPIRSGKPTFDIQTQHTFILPCQMTAEIACTYRAGMQYAYMEIKPLWMLQAGVQKRFFERRVSVKLNVQDVFWTGYPKATSAYTGYREAFIAKRDTRVIQLAVTYHFGQKQGPEPRQRSGAAEEKQRAAGTGV